MLQRCRAHGIVLSKKKFEIGRTVQFAGHNVTVGGIKPDEKRLGAISEFPTPCDTHQLRSFFGLANQLGNFLPDLVVGMGSLLRKRTAWVWTPDHEEEFVAVKKLLMSAPIAQYFDSQLETKLLTDASRSRIGFVLIQEGPDGKSKPLAAALAPTTASRPMQAVSLDLFHAGGRDYLVMVDRYSGYPFVQCLASTTAAAVTRAFAGWWELFGLPSVVQADGGPQFRCQEFFAFCGDRDIELETSSPYNPRSDGLAKAAVYLSEFPAGKLRQRPAGIL